MTTTATRKIRANCMCCGTLVEYPVSSEGFSCGVCSTKHDLIPRKSSAVTCTPITPTTNMFSEFLEFFSKKPNVPKTSYINAGDTLQPLSLPYVHELLQNHATHQDLTLKGYLTGVCRSLDYVNDAFLSEHNRSVLHDPNFSAGTTKSMAQLIMADLTDAGTGWNLLDEAGFLTTISSSFEALMIHPGRTITKPQDLRFFFVILSCEKLLAKWQANMNLFIRLFGAMSNLPGVLHPIVIECFSSLPKERLTQILRIGNSLISTFIKPLYHRPPPEAKITHGYDAREWRILSCAKFLSIMYVTMLATPSPNLALFYNSTLDTIDIGNEYDRWVRLQGFSFCQYSFLLSLTAKAAILHLDADRQMEQLATEAVINVLFGRFALPWCTLTIRRDQLLQDSLREISSKQRELKKKLRIEFVDEEGVDVGGITKEWFMLLVKELFNVDFGMFTIDDSGYMWFNYASLENDTEFHLVGVIVGLALFNGVILDIPLAPCIFFKLLNKPVNFEHLREAKPSIANGMEQILSYNEAELQDLCMFFVGTYEMFGSIVEVPLVPNGENIAVTPSNVREYVDLLVDFHLNKGCKQQYDAFAKGFFQVCPQNPVTLFHPRELELLVLGTPTIDVDLLEKNAKYDNINRNDPLIGTLWQIVRKMSPERQKRFVLFVTGTDRIPSIAVAPVVLKITLGENHDTMKLPSAHTCFNQLVIHRYRNPQVFEEKLLKAVEETSGFNVL